MPQDPDILISDQSKFYEARKQRQEVHTGSGFSTSGIAWRATSLWRGFDPVWR
jgi:hypothetical protein